MFILEVQKNECTMNEKFLEKLSRRYLGVEDSILYTSYCFRRGSAPFRADSKVNLITLRRNSSTVAEDYV